MVMNVMIFYVRGSRNVWSKKIGAQNPELFYLKVQPWQVEKEAVGTTQAKRYRHRTSPVAALGPSDFQSRSLSMLSLLTEVGDKCTVFFRKVMNVYVRSILTFSRILIPIDSIHKCLKAFDQIRPLTASK